MPELDVFVVGAGPTGLVLALWLAKQGVRVRIVDKTMGPGTTSRALAVQARTLELYRQLDLTDAVIANGHKVPAVNLWVEGSPKARMSFGQIGTGLTPYSFLQIFPQDAHEKLLIERLERFGVKVERETEVLDFREDRDQALVRLKGPGGEERVAARYIAGCDGARSLVRETLGTGFPGGTYQQIFYVADAEVSSPVANGELHVAVDEADFLAAFPLAKERHVRLIGAVREEHVEHAEAPQFDDVSRRAIRNLRIEVERVNWFSTYRVHHRVTSHFRKGRAFLLGDAAHVHSPAGGQGMNTGIGDAINLAWKLAAVVKGSAPDALLDSYETERIAFARRLVATTDRVFTFVTAEGHVADILRTRIAPLLIPRMASYDFVREYVFRTVSQITLNYRGGPLSEGAAGHVHGGDRLPWVETASGDNFRSLSEIRWHVHVYGAAGDELARWCAQRNIPLHAFAWQPSFAGAGLAPDAAYLLRPDTYVAFAGGDAVSFERYFRVRGLEAGKLSP